MGKIKGQVIDVHGSPVENATVGTQYSFALTDSDGEFEIEVPILYCELKIVHRNFKKYKRTLKFNDGESYVFIL